MIVSFCLIQTLNSHRPGLVSVIVRFLACRMDKVMHVELNRSMHTSDEGSCFLCTYCVPAVIT